MSIRSDLLISNIMGFRWRAMSNPAAGTTVSAQSPTPSHSDSRVNLETIWYSIQNMSAVGVAVQVQVKSSSIAGTVLASVQQYVPSLQSANSALSNYQLVTKRGVGIVVTMDTVAASVTQSVNATGWIEDVCTTSLNPTLVLNFKDMGAGAVDLRDSAAGAQPTFTRATAATTILSSGVIGSVASGIARSYYDPVTLQYLGYLAEGSRTQLFLNSLIDGSNLSTQGVSTTAQAYTISFYGTGSITLTGASTAGPLTGTGAYPQRVSLTFTPGVGTVTCTVSGTVQFAQFEAGSFASSFIPSAGATVTRNADSLSYPLTGWYSDTQGTFFLSGQVFTLPAENRGLICVSDNSANNRIQNFLISTGTLSSRIVTATVAANPANTANAVSASTTFKSALAVQVGANASASILNGGAVTTSSPAALPTAATMTDGLKIGDQASGVGASIAMFGTISRTVYFPRRLTNGELRDMTL